MRTILIAGSALACLMLGGCSTTGVTAGYSSDPEAWSGLVQHPRINGGKIPTPAYAEYRFIGSWCHERVKEMAAGPIQSGVGTGLIYGAAGFVGGSQAAEQAFGRAVSGPDYGIYNGGAMLASGIVNGVQTGGYAQGQGKYSCLSQSWADTLKDPKTQWTGTYVIPLSGGRKIGAKRPETAETPPRK